MGTILSSNVANMTDDEAERYRKFLESELEKMSTRKKATKINVE